MVKSVTNNSMALSWRLAADCWRSRCRAAAARRPPARARSRHVALDIRKTLSAGAAESGAAAAGSESTGTGWGTLTGTFKFVGTPPAPGKLNVDKDTEVCGKGKGIQRQLAAGRVRWRHRQHRALRPRQARARIGPAAAERQRRDSRIRSEGLHVPDARPGVPGRHQPSTSRTAIRSATTPRSIRRKGTPFNQNAARRVSAGGLHGHAPKKPCRPRCRAASTLDAGLHAAAQGQVLCRDEGRRIVRDSEPAGRRGSRDSGLARAGQRPGGTPGAATTKI